MFPWVRPRFESMKDAKRVIAEQYGDDRNIKFIQSDYDAEEGRSMYGVYKDDEWIGFCYFNRRLKFNKR